MDKLEHIFILQEQLDAKISQDHKADFDLETWIEKEILAIISELGEVLAETNFKWWKNPREINSAALKEEIIDVFHFLISLCLKVGITPEELYEVYLIKNNENLRRQEGLSEKEGYSISE
ncbi:MAG: dUTPase [Peptococcales bacterium]|jgi:dimeric dUTPase (all-alpha-NTP-PPase superfamily)